MCNRISNLMLEMLLAINPKVLGKLTSVDLRDSWEDEARDFAPWLAEAENLALLATLVIES